MSSIVCVHSVDLGGRRIIKKILLVLHEVDDPRPWTSDNLNPCVYVQPIEIMNLIKMVHYQNPILKIFYSVFM